MSVWDPFREFREMEDLRREVDRIFESFSTGRPVRRQGAFLPGRAARQYPLVNVYEDQDNLYVEALAPGIDPKALDLAVQGSTLTISGEKKPADNVPAEGYHRAEREAGKFVRTVDLPYPVGDEGVDASYKNGLLLVTLPKHEAAKPKQISVRIG